MKPLTQAEKQNIYDKIDNEGFDYYFTCYGADPKLYKLIEKQIRAYLQSKARLESALAELGIWKI